jgi:hypothetical protein
MSRSISPKKSNLSRNEMTNLWSKLGIAFSADPTGPDVDPEVTLLLSLEYAVDQRKTLKLIAQWLTAHGDLVHVERLLGMIRKGEWRDETEGKLSTRYLGALAGYLLSRGDRRWKIIASECKKMLKGSVAQFMVDEDMRFLIERDGADPHFQKFGVTIPLLLEKSRELRAGGFQNQTKLRSREYILDTNPWLRLRAALGTNWRADILFVILTGLASNAYQTGKLLGCSYETAHRIWTAAQGAKVTELFKVRVLLAKY